MGECVKSLLGLRREEGAIMRRTGAGVGVFCGLLAWSHWGIACPQFVGDGGPSPPDCAFLPNVDTWWNNNCSAVTSHVVDVGAFVSVANRTDAGDDTPEVQKAVCCARALRERRNSAGVEPGAVRVDFPPGVYTVEQIYISEGLDLLGYGATLKLIDQAPKFARLFIENEYTRTAGEGQSAPVSIRGFVLDGNSQEQVYCCTDETCAECVAASDPACSGKFDNTVEHQEPIFLGACNAGVSTCTGPDVGRLRAIIEDVVFQNSAGHGIVTQDNTNVQIQNVWSKNIFYESVFLNSAESDVQINGASFTGDIAQHLGSVNGESDGVQTGYQVSLSNVMVDGNYGINHMRESRFAIANGIALGTAIDSTIATPLNLGPGPGTSVRLADSVFAGPGCSKLTALCGGECARAKVELDNVTLRFVHTGQLADCSPESIYLEFDFTPLLIPDPRVEGTSELMPLDVSIVDSQLIAPTVASKIVTGLVRGQDTNQDPLTLMVSGGSIVGAPDIGAHMQHGTLFLQDVYTDATWAGVYNRIGGTASYHDLTIDGVRVAPEATCAFSYHRASNATNAHSLRHLNTALRTGQNPGSGTLVSSMACTVDDSTATSAYGSRLILGDGSPPAGETCVVGDVYRLASVPGSGGYEWLCRATGNTGTWDVIKSL